MVIWRRGRPKELLHHCDRGSQYTSEAFQRLMCEQGVTCSLSRSGDVWDTSQGKATGQMPPVLRVVSKKRLRHDEPEHHVWSFAK